MTELFTTGGPDTGMNRFILLRLNAPGKSLCTHWLVGKPQESQEALADKRSHMGGARRDLS